MIQDLNKGDTDLVMFLLWIGCKLSSQKLEKASSKIAQICKMVSEGEMVKRDHMQFLM